MLLEAATKQWPVETEQAKKTRCVLYSGKIKWKPIATPFRVNKRSLIALYYIVRLLFDTRVPGGPLCNIGQLHDTAAEQYRIGWEKKREC
jgi:hypothetical protein